MELESNTHKTFQISLKTAQNSLICIDFLFLSQTFFKQFPDPPLRSIHWEVRKYCELEFIDCVQYLHEVSELGEYVYRRRVELHSVPFIFVMSTLH